MPDNDTILTSFPISDFIHSYERRKNNHDYQAPFKYHIILKKQDSFPDFGKVTRDASIPPGKTGCAKISLSPCGVIIRKALFRFNDLNRQINLLQFCIMPDHVHFLVHVTERLPKHLGHYVGGLKATIAEGYSLSQKKTIMADEIFKPNYTDKIIWSS